MSRGRLFVLDGDLETELVFHDGIDLPHFAVFTLLGQPSTEAVTRLRKYYAGYLRPSSRCGLPCRGADVARQPRLGPTPRRRPATGAAHFMVNWTHPSHSRNALERGEQRIVGPRANASTKRHAELDEATALDAALAQP